MWLLYSFLMFGFSNLLYLTIRKAQKDAIPIPVYSVGMFLIPAVFYAFSAMVTGVSLILPWQTLMIVLVTGFLWSYVGNYFSLRGIELAPNSGYSLTLQKSYVIITTIAAVIIFGSAWSTTKLIAIAVIIFFSALISLTDKTHRSQPKWIIFSLIAHVCFAFGSLMSKQFLTMGLIPYQYLFYITLLVTVLNVSRVVKRKMRLIFTPSQWATIITIGLFSVGFNLFAQYGYKHAPNPGYVVAINAASVMSITLLSAWLYKDELSAQKLTGVLGVLSGLLLLAFA